MMLWISKFGCSTISVSSGYKKTLKPYLHILEYLRRIQIQIQIKKWNLWVMTVPRVCLDSCQLLAFKSYARAPSFPYWNSSPNLATVSTFASMHLTNTHKRAGDPRKFDIRLGQPKSCPGQKNSGAQLPAYLQDMRMMRKTHLSAYLRIHGDS